MPELPEVETVMRGLEPAMLKKKVKSLVFNRPNLRYDLPAGLPAQLAGKRIESLRRRGKYILCFCEGGQGFVLHLGMSGVMKVLKAGELYEAQKHDHVIISMYDGGMVVFNDARRFGFLISTHLDDWHQRAPFNKMGPEPLGNDFYTSVLFEGLRKRKGPIKVALLDQSVVAGLGNIYVCEALYRSGISPIRAACDVSAEECDLLVRAIKDVLSEAIEAGGSSLKDYRNTEGKMGYFQANFGVYDRAGQACPGCDCSIDDTGGVLRIVQAGRSSFYCPRQQR
ncbi:MAG: DNA-formamidopyrimidine glycosylase [Micavibrio sp.]|nr:DNA-formamidopyrimidine glycosylase [Micavibrio sp.]|tara:strand:+ start:3594 stop:4439 length:846 start_codon:yes stop_codon:yes gene_type:complete